MQIKKHLSSWRNGFIGLAVVVVVVAQAACSGTPGGADQGAGAGAAGAGGDDGASGGAGTRGGGGDAAGGHDPAADGGDAAGGMAGGSSATGGDGGQANDPPGTIRIGFETPDDLSNNFVIPGPAGDVTVQGGRLSFASRKARTVIFKPAPLFDQDVEISFRFNANTAHHVPPAGFVAPGVLPRVWLAFFPQSGRKQTPRVVFSWGELGNDGLTFENDADLEATSHRESASPVNSDVSITPIWDGDQFYTFTATLKRLAAGQVKCNVKIRDGELLIFNKSHTFTLGKTTGELAIGGYALNPSGANPAPLLVDDLVIRPAPAALVEDDSKYFDVPGGYRMWIPPGVDKVKGILWHALTYMPEREYTKQFCRIHDFAAIGTPKDNILSGAMKQALTSLTQLSGHAELATVPMLLYGFSAGSVGSLPSWINDPTLRSRVIAYHADAYATANHFNSDAQKIPSLITSGQTDLVPMDQQHSAHATARNGGARMALLERQGLPHAELGAFYIFMPLFERIMKSPLQKVDDSKAWLLDKNTWNAPGTDPVPMARIMPAAGFTGNLGNTSWFIDKDSAFVGAAFGAFRRAIAITHPHHGVAGDTRKIRIRVEGAMKDWSKIEVFDYASVVGTLQPGAALEFTFANLTAGVHAISAQVTHAGKVYPSMPVPLLIAPN